MRYVHVRARKAAEGLKMEIYISPSLVEQLYQNEGVDLWYVDDVDLTLEVPSLPATGDLGEMEYELAKVELRTGPEDIPSRLGYMVWDDQAHEARPREPEDDE